MMQQDGRIHFQRGSIISLIRSVSNLDYLKSNKSVLEERKSRVVNSDRHSDASIDMNVIIESNDRPGLGNNR